MGNATRRTREKKRRWMGWASAFIISSSDADNEDDPIVAAAWSKGKR
jgi:hypothetical protein